MVAILETTIRLVLRSVSARTFELSVCCKMKPSKMTKDEDLLKHGIVYEDHLYDVRRSKHGFEVYLAGITHATRCAIIGWHGLKGFEKALDEIKRRKKT